MAARETISVRDTEGRRIEAELVERAAHGLTIRGPDGDPLLIPAEMIARHEADTVELATSFADVAAVAQARSGHQVVPVAEEQPVIEKRQRPTATVRVRTTTSERDELVDEEVSVETVEVTRVSVDRFVEAPAAVRTEGDTTIVPLHEEVLVIEKRLLLKEELHLTKRQQTQRETTRVNLRSQSADVERIAPEDNEPIESDET